ncbi:MAG: hypothetical protein AB1578_18165 [Thermodesulfobacteriota bacterium]
MLDARALKAFGDDPTVRRLAGELARRLRDLRVRQTVAELRPEVGPSAAVALAAERLECSERSAWRALRRVRLDSRPPAPTGGLRASGK